MAKTMTLSDRGLLELYSYWSEELYCAGFMDPRPDVVQEFRTWLSGLALEGGGELEDFEEEMLAEFRRQEEYSREGT